MKFIGLVCGRGNCKSIYFITERGSAERQHAIYSSRFILRGLWLDSPRVCVGQPVISLPNPTQPIALFQIIAFCPEIYVLTFKSGIVLMAFRRRSHSSLFGMDQHRQDRPVLTVSSLWNGATRQREGRHSGVWPWSLLKRAHQIQACCERDFGDLQVTDRLCRISLQLLTS